jgi:hypothetical protein
MIFLADHPMDNNAIGQRFDQSTAHIRLSAWCLMENADAGC